MKPGILCNGNVLPYQDGRDWVLSAFKQNHLEWKEPGKSMVKWRRMEADRGRLSTTFQLQHWQPSMSFLTSEVNFNRLQFPIFWNLDKHRRGTSLLWLIPQRHTKGSPRLLPVAGLCCRSCSHPTHSSHAHKCGWCMQAQGFILKFYSRCLSTARVTLSFTLEGQNP